MKPPQIEPKAGVRTSKLSGSGREQGLCYSWGSSPPLLYPERNQFTHPRGRTLSLTPKPANPLLGTR
jgi:hypothetical protein